MPVSVKEIRILVSSDKITIVRSQGMPGNGNWRKDYIKLEMSIARIFHKVLNKYRLTSAFEKNDYEILGKMLFKILMMDDEAKNFFLSRVKEIREDPQTHCRIYLRFDGNVKELDTLPWEYMLIEDEHDDKLVPFYLGADPGLQFDLIRSVGDETYKKNPDKNEELRIIVIISNPINPPDKRVPLDNMALMEMFRRLQAKYKIIHTYQRIDEKPKENTFIDDLKEALQQIDGPYVLHFYGHAKMEDQKGFIGFTGDTDQLSWLADSEFADFFNSNADFMKPEVVLLQACESGQVGKHYEGDASGVAVCLALKNIPAVIGMQNVVNEDVSIDFVECFYESLLMGDDVATAVTKGRKHLGCTLKKKPRDYYCDNTFGTPVLFISTSEPIRLLPARANSSEAGPGLVDKVCTVCKWPYKQVNPAKERCTRDFCRGKLVLVEERTSQTVTNGSDTDLIRKELTQDITAIPAVPLKATESR